MQGTVCKVHALADEIETNRIVFGVLGAIHVTDPEHVTLGQFEPT